MGDQDDNMNAFVSRAAISSGLRVDLSGVSEIDMLSLRAAHSAAQELDNIIDSLKARSRTIHEDIMAMATKIVAENKVNLPDNTAIGMQIDWVDKVMDIVTMEAVAQQMEKENRNPSREK